MIAHHAPVTSHVAECSPDIKTHDVQPEETTKEYDESFQDVKEDMSP